MPQEHDEIKALLRRNLELARENNKLLKKIRRNSVIANIMRLVWWAVIIGVPVFLYYYVLEPYLIELNNTYQELQMGVTGAQNAVFDLPLISDLLERFSETQEAVTPVTE